MVWASHTDRQSTYVVRTEAPVLDPAWSVSQLGLEDLVLAYMEAHRLAGAVEPAGWRCSDDLADLAAAAAPRWPSSMRWSPPPASGSPSRVPELARLARSSDDLFGALTSTDRLLFNGGIAVLAVAPALLGVFWGAPLVARELESGTYRLAWNQ